MHRVVLRDAQFLNHAGAQLQRLLHGGNHVVERHVRLKIVLHDDIHKVARLIVGKGAALVCQGGHDRAGALCTHEIAAAARLADAHVNDCRAPCEAVSARLRHRRLGLTGVKRIATQIRRLRRVDCDIHAAQIINNVGNHLEIQQNVLFNFDAQVLADNLAQRFRPGIARDVVDAPNHAVGALHQRVADNRREHDAVRHRVQCDNHDAVGVHEFVRPLVGAEQQIVVQPFAWFGDAVIINRRNRLRGVRQRGRGQTGDEQTEHQQQTHQAFHRDFSPLSVGFGCNTASSL